MSLSRYFLPKASLKRPQPDDRVPHDTSKKAAKCNKDESKPETVVPSEYELIDLTETTEGDETTKAGAKNEDSELHSPEPSTPIKTRTGDCSHNDKSQNESDQLGIGNSATTDDRIPFSWHDVDEAISTKQSGRESNILGSNDDKNSSQEDNSGQSDRPVAATRRNPFETFAFGSTRTESSSISSSQSPQKQASLRGWVHSASSNRSDPKGIKPRTFQAGGTEWIKICDLPTPERERIVTKWLSLVDPATTDLEDRRFEVLVAARLHARCQEPSVRKAMAALRTHMTTSATLATETGSISSSLTSKTVAKADPESLFPALNCLQYFRTKAKQLVQAAKEVESRFGGQVPEGEHQLKQLPGIGPVMADLLAYVNTRGMHRKFQAKLDSRR